MTYDEMRTLSDRIEAIGTTISEFADTTPMRRGPRMDLFGADDALVRALDHLADFMSKTYRQDPAYRRWLIEQGERVPNMTDEEEDQA